jgi:hypothetical protein
MPNRQKTTRGSNLPPASLKKRKRVEPRGNRIGNRDNVAAKATLEEAGKLVELDGHHVATAMTMEVNILLALLRTKAEEAEVEKV